MITKKNWEILLQIIIPREEDGKKIVVSTLVRGNYFGEISLLKLDDGHNRYKKTLQFYYFHDLQNCHYNVKLMLFEIA